MPRPRTKTSFECSECGATSPRWEGQCRRCNAWNTLHEVIIQAGNSSKRSQNSTPAATASRLTDLPTDPPQRIAFDIPELDRVFGGGIVQGSVTLLAGDPGIGKSTLILQASASAAKSAPVLYVTGEESADQVRLRAERLSIRESNLFLLPATRLEDALHQAGEIAPRLVVIDSIQTVATEDADSAPGTPSQIQACAAALTELAKRANIPMVLTGHVTKDGGIAGPRLLEHAVDVVLQLGGQPEGGLRLLHGTKNRFGPTNEIGVFEMHEDGLRGVEDPSKTFLAHRRDETPGSAVANLIEGTRALTVEVQALTSPSTLPSPRRVATGIDSSRLHLVLAVLARRLGIPVHTQDVIVNIPGGLKVTEPAIDLALALAIVSSMRDIPVVPGLSAAAEIGLGGELRPVTQGERRSTEAKRLGMEAVLLSRQPDKPAAKRESAAGARHIETLTEAIAIAVPTWPTRNGDRPVAHTPAKRKPPASSSLRGL